MGLLWLEVNRLIEQSSAPNTQKVYQQAWSSFCSFRYEFDLEQSFPVPLDHIIQYIAYLSLHGFAYSTSSTRIAAISYYHKVHNFQDITKNFIVKKLLEGIRRNATHKDIRAPITLTILRKLPRALKCICFSNYEAKLFHAAFTLAFFGFLRIGELALSNSKSNIKTVLGINDIAITENGHLQVILRFSKTDQFGKSVTLCIQPFDDPIICPVKAMNEYLSARPSGCPVLFCHYDLKPMTQYQFSSVLKKSLSFLQIPTQKFKSHSFRIGAASVASMQNVPMDIIQTWGRWKSNAYKGYIRIKSSLFSN